MVLGLRQASSALEPRAGAVVVGPEHIRPVRGTTQDRDAGGGGGARRLRSSKRGWDMATKPRTVGGRGGGGSPFIHRCVSPRTPMMPQQHPPPPAPPLRRALPSTFGARVALLLPFSSRISASAIRCRLLSMNCVVRYLSVYQQWGRVGRGGATHRRPGD